MAATLTNRIRFEDMAVQLDNSGYAAIEGLTSCTLSMNQNLAVTGSSTPDADESYCRGLRSWTVTMGGSWIETNPECGLGATVSLDNGTSDIKGVGDITITSTADVGDVSTQSSGGVREVEPGSRRTVVQFNGVYFDPLGTGANNSELITDVIDGDQTITLLVDFGSGSSLAGTAFGERVDIIRNQADSVVRMDGTLRISGNPTASYAGATILDILAQSIYTATELTFRMTPTTAGMTRYDGSGYVTNWTVRIPLVGQIEWQATLEGDGAITETTISA